MDNSIYIGEFFVETIPPTADALRHIREEYISEATEAVILVGLRTWQGKFVDWEIGTALSDTAINSRCGLLGILLPTHPYFRTSKYNLGLIPPLLAHNCMRDSPFARIVNWRGRRDVAELQAHIHSAYLRRRRQPDPDNSRFPFGRNWNGPSNDGRQR